MNKPTVVSKEEWLKSRKELLTKEKEFTKKRDQLGKLRRNLPWTIVDKKYEFDSIDGKKSLCDLFEGRSQLIIYHFMFDPKWTEGCKSCSFIADHYNPSIVHLNNRDVSMVTVSKAPLAKLQSFKNRMGWQFNWVSSEDSEFNYDFHVSFTEEEQANGIANYNYTEQGFLVNEAPGLSVFYKDETNNIFHTYSCFSRGLDTYIGAYHLLDIVPNGRNETDLTYSMEWVRHNDKYGDKTFKDMYVELMTSKSKDK